MLDTRTLVQYNGLMLTLPQFTSFLIYQYSTPFYPYVSHLFFVFRKVNLSGERASGEHRPLPLHGERKKGPEIWSQCLSISHIWASNPPICQFSNSGGTTCSTCFSKVSESRERASGEHRALPSHEGRKQKASD